MRSLTLSNHTLRPVEKLASFSRTIDDILSGGLLNTAETDVRELDTEYVIEVAVSGMSRKDVKVWLEGRVLWVRGERRASRGGPMTREFDNRRFQRSFLLPENADPERVHARCRHGLLQVAIAKTQSARLIRVDGGHETVRVGRWESLKDRILGLLRRNRQNR